MKKMLLNMILTIILLLGMATVLWAVIPPPPVNQTLALFDTVYSSFTVNDCLSCHTTTTSGVGIADRHHLLTLPPKNLACDFCHKAVLNPATGAIDPIYTKDCLYCHNNGSPHHMSAAAAARDCAKCHGSFVDNYNDGHYIPTYAKSLVTPEPVGKIVPDRLDPTKTIVIGGCEACHTAAPATTGKSIFGNGATHHGTGLAQKAGAVGECTWCHDVTGTTTTSEIRRCESCHGAKSLHNIQADSDNSANLGSVITYQENLGYGHIGNNWDCWGCHGWVDKYSVPESSATVPAITGMSASSVKAGQTTLLTINGTSFINSDGTVTYNPVVVLTKGETKLTLTPYSMTESEVKVTIPASLAVGNYSLQIVKNDTTKSNEKNLSVVTPVAISSAKLSQGRVTISGSGFGTLPAKEFQDKVGVSIKGTPSKIISWTDTRIICSNTLAKRGVPVTVNGLFGNATKVIY